MYKFKRLQPVQTFLDFSVPDFSDNFMNNQLGLYRPAQPVKPKELIFTVYSLNNFCLAIMTLNWWVVGGREGVVFESKARPSLGLGWAVQFMVRFYDFDQHAIKTDDERHLIRTVSIFPDS